MSNLQQPVLVWEGEWSNVKAVITSMRETVTGVARQVREVIDIPMYLALARRYSDSTDQYVTSLAVGAHANLRRHDWVARTTGIVLASSYVMSKSAFLGSVKMARNGLICATMMTMILFPAEIAHRLDRTLWFSTKELKSRDY